MKKSISRLSIAALFFVLVLFSIGGTYKSISYGCDIDESYAITMSYRILQGDHLFKEMWEVHQTSAVFMTPFIYIYRIVHGNSNGMVLFLRMVGCMAAFIIALGVFHSFSKYISKPAAMILAAMFYNFSPKYLQTLEFCFLEYLFTMCFLVCILYYYHYHKKAFLFLAGISMAGCILSYPFVVAVLPLLYMLLVLQLKKAKERPGKGVLLFTAGMGICGLLFIGIVFANLSLPELLRNIPYILADDSHQISFGKKVWDMLRDILTYVWAVLPLVLISELAFLWIRKKSENKEKDSCSLRNVVMAAGILLPLYKMHQYPAVTHLLLSIIIMELLLVFFYLILRFAKWDKMTRQLLVLFGLLVIQFLCEDFGSNMSDMGVYANGGLLMPAFLLLLLILLRSMQDGRKIVLGLVAVLSLYFLLARCCLVRFTSVQPKTIWDTYYKVGLGTAENINLIEKEHIRYHSCRDSLLKFVTPEDTLLYIGSDTYLYFAIGNKIGIPSTISTPAFNASTVKYFELYPEKKPTVIAIDQYYYDLAKVQEDDTFAKWLNENYDMEHIFKEEQLWILRMEANHE